MAVDSWWTDPHSPWLVKLDRARRHLGELKEMIGAFRATEPYSVVGEPTDIKDCVNYRLHLHREPPAEIGAVVGDIVHNLRSALDNVAYGIAERNLGRPLTEREERAPEFPICTNPDAFKKHVDEKRRAELWGNRGVETLRSVQPFPPVGPDPKQPIEVIRHSERKLLQRLDHLWNVDKHRRLAVMMFFPASAGWFEADDAPTQREFRLGDRTYRDGSIIFTVLNDSSGSPIVFNLDLALVDDVPNRTSGLGHGDDVVRVMSHTLRHIVEWVLPTMAHTWESHPAPTRT